MSDGIYVALSGAIARSRQLEVAANNLSNLETTAYRKRRASFREFIGNPEALGHKQAPDAGPPPHPNRSIELIHTIPQAASPSSRPGLLKETGSPLDLALEGEGYFVLKTALGLQYTRDGHFVRGRGGALSSADGAQVMGTKGPIILPAGPVEIDEAGKVSASGEALGRLKLVDFVKAGDLLPQGVNRYKTQVSPIQSRAMVRQGKLESSNVKPLDELVQLIKLQRSFEAAWQAVQSYREMDSRAVEIGRP